MPEPLVVEGEPDLERAVRKLLGSDDAGPSVCAVVERTMLVKPNEVAPTRLRTVFCSVDPATAPPRRACAAPAADGAALTPGLSVSAPIEVFPLVGRVINAAPLPNDATGVYELRHAPGAVVQAFAGQENALPLVQHDFQRRSQTPPCSRSLSTTSATRTPLPRCLLPAYARLHRPLFPA